MSGMHNVKDEAIFSASYPSVRVRIAEIALFLPHRRFLPQYVQPRIGLCVLGQQAAEAPGLTGVQ